MQYLPSYIIRVPCISVDWVAEFSRFVPAPCSGSGSPPPFRGGAGSGAGLRLDLAACAVGFGGFWSRGSSPVLGLFWVDFGFRWVGLGRCRRGFGDAVIREAQNTS